ncbi:MAG: DUF2341 domain-containing protein, partial [Verrucomicrobiota bacterium]|nr:DUF2341 domain-containing protein [Verrucomicrobiota bacterium]
FQSSLPNVNLTWTFTHPFRVTSYKIKGQNTNFALRGPKAFLLYGSNNGSSWSVVDDMNSSSSNHQTNWTSDQERTFTADTPGDYKYYKLQETQASGSDTYLGFREVDLIGIDYSPVTDFNLMVTLDESNATFKAAGFRHSLCQANGEDLRFQSSAGAELKYEIANWNQAGKSVVWLNVPSLARNDQIIMRWGNSGSATPSYVTDGSAWSNYAGIYHLDQAVGAAATDSSPHGNHAQMNDSANPPQKASVAIAGGAYNFTKNQNRWFSASSISGTVKLDDFTLSGWVRATTNDAQDWHDYYGINTTNGGQLRVEANNNNPPRIHVPASGIVHPNLYSSNNSAGKLDADEWNHLVFTGTGGKLNLYMNGVLNTSPNFQEGAQVEGFVIAQANNNSAGAIHDEVGLHKLARHERWVNATYQSQVPGNSFVNYGTLAGPPYFEDTVSELYGKKNVAIAPFTPTVFAGGSPTYTAAGLPPGLSINSSTGQITGATDEVGASSFTVTASGANAAGVAKSASKTYSIKISDPDAYPYKMNFTLSGYAGSSTLNQFPVLLTFDSGISGFSYNSFASATAGDLRFYASTGEELPYEIETWDITGTSRIWVRSGSISGTNTVITAAWGDASQATAPSYVFDGSAWSNGYQAAWHFQEMSGLLTTDSTSNNRHLTAEGGATTGTGQVGNGIALDGSNDQLEAIGFKGVTGGAARSMETWVKTTGANQAFMSWGQDAVNKKWIWRNQGSGNLRVEVNGGGRESNSAMNNNTWRHLAAVFPENASNLNSIKFYIDGVETGYSSGYTTMPATGDYLDVRLGNDHSNRRLNGSMDEARISSVERSGDWIKAAYDNQKTSSNFVARGAVSGPRIVTSSLAVTATVGTSFAYNTTAVGTPSSYTILNLPGGLAFAPTNGTFGGSSRTAGQVYGTPISAGSYPVSIIVNYSDDDGNLTDADSNPDQLGSLFPPENPGDAQQVILNLTVNAVAPTVTSLAASSVQATKASFDGNVTNSGGDAPTIRIYYGLTDGGTTASSWTNVREIGKKGQGSFGEVIGDLIPNTTYRYRIRAYNSASTDGVWASNTISFTTQTSNLPVVNNGSVLNATGTAITFKGGVSSTGTGTVSQGTSTFTASRYPNLKLWLDANDTSTMDKGTSAGASGTPANSNAIGYWADKSGTGHHAVVYQNNNSYKPKSYSAGMNGKPTVQFDGSNDYLLLANGRTDFNGWDKLTLLVAWEDYDSGNWRNVLGNTGSTTGGWALTQRSSELRFRIVGTSGGDDRNFAWTEQQTHLGSFVYTGGVRYGTLDGVFQTMNDTGVIPNNPNADFVIGGRGQDSGTPGGASKTRISEVLIFRDALSSVDVSKLEGYLAHKWNMTNRLASGHAYSASAPTFDDPAVGVDLTLYWGSNDGGENPAEWENEVALGRFYKEQVDVNGFNGYGYQSTWRNDSYLRNVETLRSVSHDQHAQLRGEPGGSQGMYFNGTADFINSGVIRNTNGNLGWEDNFMTLFTTTFNAPSTGNYQFKMDQKDDRHAMWIDLDQDGVFEGGSGTNGSSSTNGGNELLNPNM